MSNSRNASGDFKAYNVGGVGAMISADKKKMEGGRSTSIGSAYRDGSVGRGANLTNIAQVQEGVVEISSDELKDLQTTVQINKDIVKSLIEAQ